MAVYYNLAIDCDQNELLAKRLSDFFDGYVIESDSIGARVCRSEHILPKCYWGHRNKPSDAGDWHKVCVAIDGMSMGEGLNDQSLGAVRGDLYKVLADPIRDFQGYRAAHFGCEAQDFLGDADWLPRLKRLDKTAQLERPHHGLILAQHLISNPRLSEQLEVFAPGYLWFNRALQL